MPDNRRSAKMASIIRRTVSESLYEQLPGEYIVISDIDLSADFRHCQIWVKLLKNKENLESLLDSTKKGAQKKLAKRLSTKFTPKLNLRIDKS